MSLATKYRPKTWEDVTEQGLVIQMLKSMCESELSNRCFLLTGPAGTGKAQPLDSHVLTPNGFIEMRDVKIGTEVITGQGHIGKVSGIYPQGARPIYELVLSDGGSIQVADLHLNVVYAEGSIKVVTTDYLVGLFGDGLNLYIPRADLSNYSCATDDIPNTDEYRMIENIHYIGEEDCQCIMIDHEDHTYVSDDYILTHNTTTGRLIATYLNGSTDNLIEIDAASNNGVDDMRNLVQQSSVYPIGTNYKIWLLDEVHSLTPNSWQVLLKTLEEQPAKSVYILCTTNPEKIPPTILSRVQSFQLSKISLEGIYNRLKYVMDSEIQEGNPYTYTDDAILYIAKLSNGGMRDSLTLLEKSIAYSSNVTTENVVKALNLPNYDDYFKLLGAYAKKDNSKITEIIDSVYNSGVNFQKWFEGFHSFVMNVVKYIFLQDIQKTMIPSYYESKISKYNTNHVIICLKLANKLVDLNNALKTTQYLQETALTYLCSIPKKDVNA